ncbi:MAG: hypothetical protein JWP34_1639, partial [Massilia sp.]|nr:hypothetical protein [Massilia sp.]
SDLSVTQRASVAAAPARGPGAA